MCEWRRKEKRPRESVWRRETTRPHQPLLTFFSPSKNEEIWGGMRGNPCASHRRRERSGARGRGAFGSLEGGREGGREGR